MNVLRLISQLIGIETLRLTLSINEQSKYRPVCSSLVITHYIYSNLNNYSRVLLTYYLFNELCDLFL